MNTKVKKPRNIIVEMDQKLAFARVFFAILFLMLSLAGAHNAKLFDVRNYGAVADGQTDNRKVISTNVMIFISYSIFFSKIF